MAEKIITVIEGLDETIIPIIDKTSEKVEFISESDKAKLDALSVSGAMNVQPDWNETDPSSFAFINNKPESFTSAISAIPGLQAELDSKQASGDYALNSTLSEAVSALQIDIDSKQASGDYATITDVNAAVSGVLNSFTSSGDGTKFLSDDGTYKQLTYTNNNPIASKLGGVDIGTTFDNNTIKEMFDMLLYPYQAPYFSSFSFTLTSPVEVGTTISGVQSFSWTTANSANVSGGVVSIYDFTSGNIPITSNTANDGSEFLDIGSITLNTMSNYTWRIVGYSTKDIMFYKDFIIGWRFKLYYGSAGETIDADGIKSLPSNLADGLAGIYSYPAGGYKYICYPSQFGAATSFKDVDTNFDVPFDFIGVLPVINDNDVTANYNIYRSSNILNSDITISIS